MTTTITRPDVSALPSAPKVSKERMKNVATEGEPTPPPCASDPERWLTATPDQDAVWQCRLVCNRRFECAREAWETPAAFGLWAGVVIPEAQRPRDFAFRKLKELAELGGFPVRVEVRRYRGRTIVVCVGCGTEFMGGNAAAAFCSSACRQSTYSARTPEEVA